jgi:CDP-glucose 4,6-dehydratase
VGKREGTVGRAVTPAFWRGKTVLVTGHTGFKGAWLTCWLRHLGATVIGYALEPETDPALSTAISITDLCESHIGDIRDLPALRDVVARSAPDIVFHLAAQSIVLESYDDPIGTYGTNVMGTAHMLECARASQTTRAVVVVTSDKCYRNQNWDWGYRENDALGGSDPYSNSKSCAELVTESYRSSFFGGDDTPGIASARAGNVIGGGDWAPYRLIPDMVRAIASGEVLELRHPKAVRPWQLVLEPLGGYLVLAEQLYAGTGADGAWNFGPPAEDGWDVESVVRLFRSAWNGQPEVRLDDGDIKPETQALRLDSSKARLELDWSPCLSVEQAMDWTVRWYRSYSEAPETALAQTQAQIDDYMRLMCR